VRHAYIFPNPGFQRQPISTSTSSSKFKFMCKPDSEYDSTRTTSGCESGSSGSVELEVIL
jgi:hypothetical protein